MRTLHEIGTILREAGGNDDGPLSLAEIGHRMGARSVRHATIRACVDELKRSHLVTEGPSVGVMWTLYEDPAFWDDDGAVRLA